MRRAVRALVIRGDNILLMRRNKFGEEYYTLPGGSIDVGEMPEQTLVREVREETSLVAKNYRLVFTESQPMYGRQEIYWCEVDGGEPVLSPDSDEAKINELGQNMHTPLWFPLKDLPGVTMRTPLLQQAILLAVQYGFPASVVAIDERYIEDVQTKLQVKKGFI